MYSSLLCLLYIIGHVAVPAVASALCYAPDGSLSPGDGYLPCINTLNVDSMCCVLNLTALKEVNQPASNADTCSTSGLCQLSTGDFSRNYCTDKTWNSPNCLNVCTGGASGGTSSSYSGLTHCADGSWCCGQGNLTSCCNVGLGFQLAASIPPYAASATGAVTATTTAAAAATATSTVTSTSTPTSGPSSANNNGVGIGLGVALGVVLLAAAAMGLVLCRRRRTRRRRDGQLAGEATETGHGYHAPKNELEQPSVIHEVPSRRDPVELDGGFGRR